MLETLVPGVLVVLGYTLIGTAKGLFVDGGMFSIKKFGSALGAGLFVALVFPELLPSLDLANPLQWIVAATTSVAAFGIIYVVQKLYAVGYEVIERLETAIDDFRLSRSDSSAMRPKIRARKPKPKPQQTPP